ncbi:hypothetical protein SAMN04488595_11865 [Ralstonia sp. 25mfcol4.1]|nr:hypothetical protein SAMN04488595_11865 [Ralstonia sp. 25mfcol4.1]
MDEEGEDLAPRLSIKIRLNENLACGAIAVENQAEVGVLSRACLRETGHQSKRSSKKGCLHGDQRADTLWSLKARNIAAAITTTSA